MDGQADLSGQPISGENLPPPKDEENSRGRNAGNRINITDNSALRLLS